MGKKGRRKGKKNKRSNYSRYVYLGKRVPDVGKPGLDRPSEFRKIERAIVRDYKSGRISKRKARGRLLLLYRLTDPRKNSNVKDWSPRTRKSVRSDIRKAMRSL